MERYLDASVKRIDRARILVADTNARLKERMGRIIFRAWRRGFREADLVLGPFAEQVGPTLDTAELDAFESMLEAEDHDLYAWIIGKTPIPAEHDGPVMARLQAFMREHVAAVVAEGAG
ncbi:MAG: antitoxin CptB [Brevundimonas sp.]|jgi:antitoxin CptB|uniref:FAD assembly factor SdhE n=2 Tax=Brevundimonas sp. TaxID=1871086 RepID=UPI002489CEAA|nr:succinate dehydrogenase assembly factor 2 [Brevundimonas sp.]MDI1280743.1 succinate dehydrogenase assembly factor 2 [Brevundimonas sp.]